MDSNKAADNIFDFVIEYSQSNNITITTGAKDNDLYQTQLCTNIQVHLSVNSHHFHPLKDLVYYFYLVFNCPHFETFCHLASSSQIYGLPKER